MGVPPTGKRIVGRMTVWDCVMGGKVVSSDVFVDMAHLMVQMGVMEPPKMMMA
jgi:predicted ester cyclase